jgi:RNA polymerase sigma-70 factor (ECF subfamily)
MRGEARTDGELVARARREPAEFVALYRKYVDAVYGLAMRRARSREVAEDVTSTTFEHALRHLDRVAPGDDTFRPWLFRIAANTLVDHHRREQRPFTTRGRRAFLLHALPPADDCFDVFEREEDVERVVRSLDQLTPRHQQVITLRYLADLDPDEAASAMGCSKGTLAVTLHRALTALRRAVLNSAAQPDGATEEVAG